MIKLIVVKNYHEFTEEVHFPVPFTEDPSDFPSEYQIVAKEIEAVIQTDDKLEFSIGFSVHRNNPLFEELDPREMVRKFILENLPKLVSNDPAHE